VGIEAGLYARYLGYRVVILEQGEIADHVLAWGHLQMLSPFSQVRSTLGLAALKAQDPQYHPPEPDARLTGRQWVDRYLLPLSRTDLLADEVRCHARVAGVGREHAQSPGAQHDEQRPGEGFQILVEHAHRQQTHEQADIVIDCTGVYPPDYALYEEPLVTRSPVTGGLATEGAHRGDDATDRADSLPARLLAPAPNSYVLGAKSFGRDARFLVTDGLRQIRDLFAIIGGRRELDLYATAEHLAR
jgi:hypothetical protein